MLKEFISYYKPHKKLFVLDMIAAFIVALCDLFYPMITRQIINDIIPNGKIRLLFFWAISLLIIYMMKYFLNHFIQYWGHMVGVRIQADMRKKVFNHLQTLPFTYFDENKTGVIMSRIINDLMEISELAHHGPEDLFISIIMLIGSFIILCTINIPLTIISFIFIPILVWFSMKNRLKMEKAFMDSRVKIGDLNAELENSIAGIRVAKAFTNRDYENEKFEMGNKRFVGARQMAYKSMADYFSGMYFFIDILDLIVLIAGGYFVYKNLINFGDLVAYLLFIKMFMTPIRKLISFVEQYQSGVTGFERYRQLLRVKPEEDKEEAEVLENIKGAIEFKNVSFKYDEDTHILNDLSFKVEEGKTLALVGPSGGGKTTLCNLIPRFYNIDNGDILIDNNSIYDVKIGSLRKNIGIVQQDVFLFTGTIKENILYGNPEASYEEVVKAAKLANIHEFIESLPEGYNTYIGERGIKLSGGQKQRLSIARVFLKNPPILILDEATSALDNATEYLIQKSLEKLSNGRTTIVVAHRLSTIKNADEIMVLTDKGIEERGTHEELLALDGIYSELNRNIEKTKG
ncbi:ABC transporter ATP-binding protein [Clostridium botulinum]|uniref:ABC transporter ATP-binding protein n=2 Tax=Clostridium botulinum TaxID=1491 RepID=A0A6G4EIW3_CLOBO|nr:ABC transporter ATP-binding protein [Clostridium botulinum]APH20686.1 ABC transporter family protein [Clostridium botulinum]AUM91009.1 thiamine ABC transporter permease [Clostridium botulinum]NFB14869.1 ABC transporter ATP-binding protein [Clostridium botulinum]NFH59908.1 ABC transporter ATP-binding protein [Clostridium botulinum]NFH63094.1 ABC transporter ATP-binding protein [Clostridium botulinum]